MILSIDFYENPETGLQLGPMVRETAGEGFGERVRLLIRELGMEQKKLAQDSGIPASTTNSILNGTIRNPSLKDAAAMARALAVPLDSLAYDDEAPPTSPLTPYDLNEDYRSLIDMLEAIDPADRDRFVTFITWTLKKISEGVGNPSARSLLSETATTTQKVSSRKRPGMGMTLPGETGGHDPSEDSSGALRTDETQGVGRSSAVDGGARGEPERRPSKRRRRT
jgi:transcriptional regulator with XRE-family HTH domain